ncbi:5'/3'-nucleotidase sure [Xylariomycetidae sp. FL2044]|nr:5'/3'-nucleotidase sure [Xylariomycetidae sp. FL2044]
MHILVTNDDGPPSPEASPYVHCLVRHLQKAGHTVSVCLPDKQCSWIGKAHIIGKTVKPLYYRPSDTFDPRLSASSITQGTTHKRPDPTGTLEEWILVDGPPATSAHIGINHFFEDKGPIDLVVSGPNFGRNSTALFALSSGTLGAALEAAVCNKKAIALSYAFFDPKTKHEPALIEEATRHSVRVIEKLYAQWPEDKSVDVYTLNVPLKAGVEKAKTLWTSMLQNYWPPHAACFQAIDGGVGDAEEEEEAIREQETAGDKNKTDGQSTTTQVRRGGHKHKHLKWAPDFGAVMRTIEGTPQTNDGWAVREGLTSITPLKANFWHSATHLHGTELKMDEPDHQDEKISIMTPAIQSTLAHRPKDHFYALIDYGDDYVQPLILTALSKLLPPESYTLLTLPTSSTPYSPLSSDTEPSIPTLFPFLSPSPASAASPPPKLLQITPYESIDWAYAATHPGTCTVNSYMLRKALIRKHYLASTVEHWVAKRPGSVLATHVKRTEAFELDYAEFLDDALVECWDLRASLERNENASGEGGAGMEKEVWILKPSMSDRGQGIRLFSTMAELEGIFQGWEEDEEEDEDEDEGEGEVEGKGSDDHHVDVDHITTSHLRHFVAQPYIHPPLLLPGDGDGGRKFHIRAYVLCAGALDVYVYRDMLALFAAKPYSAPFGGTAADASTADPEVSASSSDDIDLESHLTNTCLQRSVAEGTVQRFWDLDSLPHSSSSSPSSSSFPSYPPSSSHPTSSAASHDNNGSSKDTGEGENEQENAEKEISSISKTSIFHQICAVTGEVFEAAARGMRMHFSPLPNAFEVFGLDFLVDARGKVWLLEVNSFPDFRQTGDELSELVLGLWEGVLEKGFLRRRAAGKGDGEREREKEEEEEKMVHVRRVDLGV